MSEWIKTLAPRERVAAGLAAVMLVLFLLWLAAWRPMAQQRALVASQIESQTAELDWMRAAAVEVRRLKGQSPQAAPDRGNQSLLALSEQTARDAGLGSAFRRGEPAGAGQVRIWLKGASFDALVSWLETIESSYAVVVADGTLERTGVSGQVDARLLLAEP